MSTELIRIDSKVNGLLDDKNWYIETVAFEIPVKVVKELAALYTPGKIGNWRFRISAHSGDSKDLSLPYAEIAALAERIDQYLISLQGGTKK